MARARRTKSGRYAKARRNPARSRASTRGRRYAVKRRTGSYSPKKGQRRLAPARARRAYARRRPRRNQRGILASPAVKYSLAAAAGFGASSWANQADIFNPENEAGEPLLPMGIKGGILLGVLSFVLSEFALKGQNKQLARAFGVGALAPVAIDAIQKGMSPNNTAGGAYHNRIAGRRARMGLASPSRSAQSFARASMALDNTA